MSKMLFSAVMVFLSTSVMAEDTVFGISLGTRFTVPECRRDGGRYRDPASAPCFKRFFDRQDSVLPVSDETVNIQFPSSQSPSVIAGDVMSGLILNGKLEGIGFDTGGLRTQKDVLAALKEKYGEPTSFQSRTLRNVYGASFDMFRARWTSSTLEVDFQNILGGFDSAGLVQIDTRKGAAWRAQQEPQPKRPKL